MHISQVEDDARANPCLNVCRTRAVFVTMVRHVVSLPCAVPRPWNVGVPDTHVYYRFFACSIEFLSRICEVNIPDRKRCSWVGRVVERL
jgi:hypothetical protein